MIMKYSTYFLVLTFEGDLRYITIASHSTFCLSFFDGIYEFLSLVPFCKNSTIYKGS